jgi:hypothetical protein
VTGEPITTPDQVVKIELDLHRQLGARHLIGERCLECDKWTFGNLDNHPSAPLLVCGFCGLDWVAGLGRRSLRRSQLPPAPP